MTSSEFMFLRLIPTVSMTELGNAKAYNLVREYGLEPMRNATVATGVSYSRNRFGAVAYFGDYDGKLAFGLTQLFRSGELWSIDAITLDKESSRDPAMGDFGIVWSPDVRAVFLNTFNRVLEFATSHLNLRSPLRVRAGLAGVKGYRLGGGERRRIGGECYADNIIHEEILDDANVESQEFLEPFFSKFADDFGEETF